MRQLTEAEVKAMNKTDKERIAEELEAISLKYKSMESADLVAAFMACIHGRLAPNVPVSTFQTQFGSMLQQAYINGLPIESREDAARTIATIFDDVADGYEKLRNPIPEDQIQ